MVWLDECRRGEEGQRTECEQTSIIMVRCGTRTEASSADGTQALAAMAKESIASEACAECGSSAIAVADDVAGAGVADERGCDVVTLRLRGDSSGTADSVLG